MAVDQNTAPKDLRPLNSTRNPLPAPPPPWADQPDDAPDDQPAARKVKFLCSFGGHILPRPSDGILRYIGGQTRIIAVRRDATLPEIMHKMAEAYGGPVALRYQLPDVDLDALVSVSSPEDLDNMMEEYDRLAEAAPDGSAKLRVFLFSPSDLATAADPVPHLELNDTGQRYVDAINGISAEGSLRRKDSLASASSTQNSDGPQIASEAVADGINEAAASNDPSRLFFVGAPTPVGFPDAPGLPANPPAMGSTVPAQTSNPSQLELPSLLPYAPQVYVDPNQVQYINHQSFGMSAGSLPIKVVSIPSHSYVPHAVDISAVSMVSQASSAKPVPAKMDPYLEENPYGERAAQLHSDPNYKSAYKPLSQLPPLPPAYLQPQNVELHGLRQAVPLPPQGQALRLEDCYMCQKALPHVHSDTLIQGNGSGGAAPEASTVFHSLHSEDATRLRAPHRVATGPPAESVVEPKTESMVTTGQFGAYGFTQIPETRHDNERPVLLNTESFDHGKVLHPPGTMGLPSDRQASYGMFVNFPQSRHEDSMQQPQQQLSLSLGQPQFPVKPDVIAKPYGNDVYPGKNVNVHGTKPLSQDSVIESSYDYVRPIDGMMEALCVTPFENLGFNEKWKSVVTSNLGVSKELKSENPPVAVENSHPVRPQVGGNTMFVGNAFINPGIVPEGNYVSPTDQLPPSSLGFTQLHNLQPAVPSQVSTSGAYLFNQETGAHPMVPKELLHGMPAYSRGIYIAYDNNTINKTPTGDLKDEASWYPKDVLNDLVVPPSDSVPFPLPNSSGATVHVEQYQEFIPSDSLFCNQDPRKILGNTDLLHLRPARVASKESVTPKDLFTENHLINNKGLDIAVLLEEGVFHQPFNSLNKDSCPEPPDREGSAEEQIKQELQAVAEGVAASVLQSSLPPVPILVAHETKEPIPQSNKERGVIEDITSLQSAAALGDDRTKDIKTKRLDKMNLGFPIGDEIGRLQIIKNIDLEELRELGSGTFGTVYHGKWRGSDVAIKRINDRCFAGKPSEQERMRADFWNEACKLADLHHPNVVAFYGVVLDGPGGSVATVTEYMVNGSLRHVLQKFDKTLDHYKRLLIAMDVAFGMEYLHGKSIVHFDLKSDNLLVNLRDPQRPICKVGDLGLSKVKCKTLISGGVRGTLPWMAPELLNGSSSLVSEKVDVFSFGIVMWELLTGEEPYADLHYGAIIGGIVNNTLRPPVPESCDPDWRSLMEKCWSSEPFERPSFTEIASRLRAMATSLPPKGRPHEQPPGQSQPQR